VRPVEGEGFDGIERTVLVPVVMTMLGLFDEDLLGVASPGPCGDPGLALLAALRISTVADDGAIRLPVR
jgi:hypothetical protein